MPIFRSLRTGSAALAAIALFTACGADSSGPSLRATTVAPAITAAVSGTAGLALPASPTFVVNDQNGSPLAGVAFTVAVTAGGGTITGAPTATAAGPTSIGTWTLGKTAGANTVTVSVAGLAPITIIATGAAGPAAQLVVSAGNAQAVPANTNAVTTARVVSVRDQFGNGVAAQPVTFAVTAGGGTLAATTATTDANGNATVPTWTVGKSLAAQTVRATSGSLTADVTATINSSYNIDVRFFGTPMTDDQKALFTNAAARISGFITGDVAGVSLVDQDVSNSCGATGVAPLNETIDDIIIYASIQNIDGAGKILAQAGPCYVRTATSANPRLTIVGVMEFDASDLTLLTANGSLQDVITHEMLHVLGVGSLWTSANRADVNLATVNFTGINAINGCRDHGGTTACATNVPVENTGGAGTANSHWRETTFRNELMTGFINKGVNPISQMTIGSLRDLGYTVNVLSFDEYLVPTPASLSASRASFSISGTPDEPHSAWERVFTIKELPITVAPGVGLVKIDRSAP